LLKRYVGQHSPVQVVIAGNDFGFVETGDAIAVPDELANSVAWPESNWSDEATPQADEAPQITDSADNEPPANELEEGDN